MVSVKIYILKTCFLMCHLLLEGKGVSLRNFFSNKKEYFIGILHIIYKYSNNIKNNVN